MFDDYWREMKSSRRCSIYAYKDKLYCFSLIGAENGQFEGDNVVILDRQAGAEKIGQTLIELFDHYRCEKKFYKWDAVDKKVREILGEKSKKKFEKESICLIVILRKKKITIHYPVIGSPNLSMNEIGDIMLDPEVLGDKIINVLQMYETK